MPTMKRKRPHDDVVPEPSAQPAPTRRATRQTPIQTPVPPPQIPKMRQTQLNFPIKVPPQPQSQPQPQPQSQPPPQPPPPPPPPPQPPSQPPPQPQASAPLSPPARRGRPPRTAVPPPSDKMPAAARSNAAATASQKSDSRLGGGAASTPLKVIEPPVQETRATRHRAAVVESGGIASKENVRPASLVAPEISYSHTNHSARPVAPPVPVPRAQPAAGLQHIAPPVRTYKPPTQVTAIPAPIPPAPSLMQHPLIHKPIPPPSAPVVPEKPPDRKEPPSDRNIDKVVLGNICFRAWYPSFYGKEVLGDTSGNHVKVNGSKSGGKNGTEAGPAGAKTAHHSRRDKDALLDRLYVCPCCFKYSVQLVQWWEHVRVCEQTGFIPGRRIYVHPKGRRLVQVPFANTGRGRPKKKPESGGQRYTEEFVQDDGEWSIWEVDGEKDVLFCQNLSLFAKLFLDNKSVFFDVTGFNYFLLVHTPGPKSRASNGPAAPSASPHHITGFFSKEKMSWDNNNLACILVFPPWQRKGLGALLMGVSYEISRREGILGGPEKPISDLGKKGYKRFWAGEVARWLLSLEKSDDVVLHTNPTTGREEIMIDLEDCSKATWIVPEDCLLVLREMSVVEDAGKGPGKPVEKTKEEGEEEGAEPAPPPKEVFRVRIDKEAVRQWVKMHGIKMDRTVDPTGFVEGYAIKPVETSEEEL